MVAVTLIVYADFDSAKSYLASLRTDALVAAGVAVEWRAVQRRPERPVTGEQITPDVQDELTRVFAELDTLLLPGETFPRIVPTSAPNTEAAVSAYAESFGTSVAEDVRRLMFDLYWTHGADIGNPNVLRTPLAGPMLRANAGSDSMRHVGYAVSVSRGPITTDAYRRINAWRDEWQRLGCPETPVVLVDGATSVGIDAVRRLGKEIVYRGADIHPVATDSRRYPAVDGTPPPAWVSQIGGRWRHLYRPGGTAGQNVRTIHGSATDRPSAQ
jgi:2-hydroxychromene-2-carboxylate isomerase